MSESDKLESLSALMDAEASELEVRRILKGAAADAEISETWRRYHVAQSLMKGQSAGCSVDISASVMQAIEQESSAPQSKTDSSGWIQGVASMAVAATVTLAVFLGLQNFTTGPAGESMQQAGVIERSSNSSYLLPTSLSSSDEAKAVRSVPAIEVIRLSEDMRESIDSYQQTQSALSAPWQPAWLPEGYTEAGVQLSDQGMTRLYSRSDQLLTLAVEPIDLTSKTAGSYSDQGVTALGRVANEHFVSVVGELSLADADRIINSLKWNDNSAQ